MAKFVLKDCQIKIDAVDLSNNASQVAIELPDDEVDLTGFQSAYKEHGKGLSDASIQVTFFQDFAATKVDETLFPLKGEDEPFIVEVQPFTGAKSKTNPIFKMECLMYNYNPISGSIGQASTTQVTFKNATQKGLERITE